MSEKTHDRGTTRLACVLLVAQALMGTSGFFFNGVVNDAGAAVVDELRDWATLAQIAMLLLLALIARRCPRLISLRASVVLFCAAELVGMPLAWFGCAAGLAVPLVAGSCLTALARAWVSLGFLVLLARLELWQTAAVLAVGNALSIPLAGLISGAGYGAAMACDAFFTLALIALIARLAAGDFASMAQAEPAADAELTSPRAVLSLRHDLFVYTFLFCMAYGFGLRYENADGGLLANGLLVALFVGIGAVALVQRTAFRADSLFEASFILALVGFLLVLLDDASLAWHASVTLTASSEVFAVLMCLALAAVAARSRAGAFYTIAWGYAAYYAGIEVGALLGMYATGLGTEGHLLAKALVAGVFAVVCVYTLYSIRDFGFDKTIEGVQSAPQLAPDGAAVQAGPRDAGIDARCAVLARQYGLTERESEVFCLLARGNNAARVSQELAITKNTLKYHVRHIYEKCAVHSQQELIDLL